MESVYILVILGMAVTFLLVVTFVMFTVRGQNKLLKQRQQFQAAQLAHQKELLKVVIESQEAERKRIGQDLHDDVGTSLSGLRLIIEMFKPSSPDDENYLKFIGSSKSIIDKVVKDVRHISHNLSPATLGYYGLAAAVNEHTGIINQSGKLEINVDNNAPEQLAGLELSAATAIYRVLEELLNNTIKHSGASKANITFKAEDNVLLVDYSDNGKGLPQSAVNIKKGMGMQNIESRLMNINATYELEATPGKGFHISIKYPLS